MGPNPVSALIRRGQTDTEEKPCEDGGRGWGDMATNLGTQELEEDPPCSLRSDVALTHLNMGLQAPECERMNSCYFKLPSVWSLVMATPGDLFRSW